MTTGNCLLDNLLLILRGNLFALLLKIDLRQFTEKQFYRINVKQCGTRNERKIGKNKIRLIETNKYHSIN